MKKMSKKTIMLSAVALIAANALTFGPVSYKVSAADPVVVSAVGTTAVGKLNNVYAQLTPDLKSLVDPAATQVQNYITNTADMALLLPNLWAALDVEIDPADRAAVKSELTAVVKLAVMELYPNITNATPALNESLENLAVLLGEDKGFTTLNRADIDSFVNEVERLALLAIKNKPLASIDSFEEISALFTSQFDTLVDQQWASSNFKVVTLLKQLYTDKQDLKDDFTTVRTAVENQFVADPLVYKKAGAALGLAYVKASLVTEGALSAPQRINATNYQFNTIKILGVSSLPFSAFDFEATDVTFDDSTGALVATTASAITSPKDIVIKATLKPGALVPSYLENEVVFTQTVTLRPSSSTGGGEFVDTTIGLIPNASTIAQNISAKLASALVEIGEVDTNKDLFALRAIVEDELRAALTINAAGQLTNNNGISELKLSVADLSDILNQVEAIVKTANEALQAVVEGADPVKPVLNLSVGNQADVKVVLTSELINAIKAKGIYAIGVISNGVIIEVPITELEGNSVLQITKNTGITPVLKAGMKQVSDVFNVSVFDAEGNEKHEFKSQARLVLPVNSGSVGQMNYLTLAKIEDGKLINLGGSYNPAKTQFSAMRNTFSSYVVVENPVAFKDISALAWAEDDILKAASKGIIVGRAEGVFAPRAEITRAEFTAMLVRTLGIEAESHTEAFTDVNDSDWYQSVVATAAAYGFINGRSSTEFDPDAPITRSEMATITSNVLVKVLGYKSVSDVNDALSVFTDQAAIVPAHRSGVALVAQEEIVQGKGLGVYDPKGTFTRAEAAVVINKLFELR